MTENPEVTGRSADGQDAIDHISWEAALRQRALAHARVPPPRNPRLVVYAAVVCAVLAHLLFALWLRDLMRTRPVADSDRIAVRLIDAPLPEPMLPEPEPPPAPALAPARPAPSHDTQVTARALATPSIAPAAPPPSLHLYNPDGSIILPSTQNDAMTARIAPDAFVAQSTAPSPLMLPRRSLKVRPNHFASVWKSGKTFALLDSVNEFIDQHLTVKGETTVPGLGKVKCQASYLIIVVGGCGWGFPPPPGGRPTEHWKPATELDEQ